MTTISSQRYIDEETVARKLAESDFAVLVTPEFAYDGGDYRVVLDGHHSLEAARRAGVAPKFETATMAHSDDLADLASGDDDVIGEWLRRHHSDEAGVDWYDIESGDLVW